MAPGPDIEALNLAREAASELKADEWEMIVQVALVPMRTTAYLLSKRYL